jgi:hypothetical protein
MSSHHFVKEGQEPALIISGPGESELIRSLLEWAPLVIVFEKAVEQIEQLGIKADVVFSNPASLTSITEKLAYQMPVKVISSSDEEMLENALEFIVTGNQRFVNVCGSMHANFFDISEKFMDRTEITLFDGSVKWSSIPSGHFRKWLPAGSRLEIRSKTSFEVQGAVALNQNQVKALADSIVAIHSGTFFWVAEFLE